MEFNQKQQYQLVAEQYEPLKLFLAGESQEGGEVAPGVAVVRSNTPKPRPPLTDEQSQEPQHLPSFPSKAPSAPPLPEELGETEEERAGIGTIPLSSRPKPIMQDAQEFVWLFEYGLEMDSAILNSPDRLDGLALLYGPAVLRGYSLMCGKGNGQTIATIVPTPHQSGAEVWGVLYRIPRRLTESGSRDAAPLDIAHNAIGPQSPFKVMQIVVQETYREREIACLTYCATEYTRQQWQLHTPDPSGSDAVFLQRLISIARKQKLPDSYLQKLPLESAIQIPVRIEQNTEPLYLLQEAKNSLSTVSETGQISASISSNRWLIAFAVYLVILLLLTLTFAIMQGLGFADQLLTTRFMPLSVPWQVLAYGLIGGCISSIVTLGRHRADNPPLFIIITWFTRPYIGIVLAIFTYLFLTSGLFFFGDGSGHDTAFLLAGALAGLCEGCIFLKKKRA